MIARVATPSSGGPTEPVAVRTPCTAWQLPQPYWMNIASPRRGSPPLIAAACDRICDRSRRYSYAMPIRPATNSRPASTARTTLVDGERMASLQPFVEENERGDAVDQSARNPHDEPGELL